MIQVNLLPDVKQKLLKLQRTRNLVVSVAILIAASAVISVVIMVGWLFAVKGAEMLADNTIESEYAKLSETKDLEKSLTIKNQLEEISSSHNDKNITSRIFNLLSVVQSSVGDQVKFSSVNADTTSRNISIEAQASSFSAIETFKKTLEKTLLEYKEGDENDKKTVSVASDIKIPESSITENQEGEKVVSFKIEFTYHEAVLLYSSREAFFKAPEKTIATDSRLNIPNSIFTRGIKNKDSKGDE